MTDWREFVRWPTAGDGENPAKGQGPTKVPVPPSLVEQFISGLWRTAPRDPQAATFLAGHPNEEVERAADAANMRATRPLAGTVPERPEARPAEIMATANRARRERFQEAGRNEYGPAWPSIYGGGHLRQQDTRQLEADAGLAPGATSRRSREEDAMLSIIREFEGTDLYENPYETLVGGRQIPLDSITEFPREVGHVSVEGPSRAYGAYQFIPGTWAARMRDLGLPDRQLPTPDLQDQAAIVNAVNAYRRYNGRDLRQDLYNPDRWGDIAHGLGLEWASFPGRLGSRHGRQRTAADFTTAMRSRLAQASSQNPADETEMLGVGSHQRAASGFVSPLRGRDRPIATRRPER